MPWLKLENIWENRIAKGKNKMAETREESQTTVLAEQNERSIAKENQTGLSPFEEPKTNKSVFQSKP